MFISKNTLTNFLKENNLEAESTSAALKELLRFFIRDGQDVEIAKDIALDADLLDSIFKQFPNSKVTILSGYDKRQLYPFFDGLYTEEESIVLAQNINQIKQTYNRDITFDEGFSVGQALKASRTINNIVKEISEARLDRKPLSPYEKFLWAYQFVTDRVYINELSNEDPSVSRNLVSVLSGDKIVCVGYASMLCSILSQLGIPCAYQSEISFDTKDNIYVNHATCAVRIDDDKYNKHGIYYSDPTADSAPVKRNTYGLTSFNNALIPYRNIPDLFIHPNALDKVITSFVKTDDINEVLSNALDTPKILSKLFPEKTKGKSQDILIKEYAKSEIENSNIFEIMEYKLDLLTDEKITQDYNEYLKNILKVPMLVNMVSFGNFAQHIRSNINSLYLYGLTKEEILEALKSVYTEEAVKEYIVSSHRKKRLLDNPKTKSLCQKEIDSVLSSLKKIDKVVDTFNFEKAKLLDPERAIQKLAERLAKDNVRHHFFKDSESFSAEEVGALLKQGYSFEDIIVAIKNKLKTLDLAEIFLEEHPENLTLYATTNENEIYATQAPPDRIYNQPYEEDFERLTNSATVFVNEEIFKAFINIYMAQGNNFSFAQELACLTLRKTDLPTFENN